MIKANFNAYASYVTDSLHQWDIDQVMSVSGLNLAVVPEVHFSNANTDRAIVRQATMKNHVVSVGVPNSLLQDPLRIYAHIGIYEGSTFKVVELVEIPVIPRKRPADYQIKDTDEEIYSFKALENAIANMVTAREAAAISARIDTIVANANSTDGNSELVDMRVGADGTTYTSAGHAIRTQVNAVKETMERAGIYAEEILNGTDKPNFYVYKNAANLVENASETRGYLTYDVTNHTGRYVYVSTVTESETMYAYIFTDADGNVIDHLNGAMDYKTVAAIPDDAVTLYVNYALTAANSVKVKLVDTLDVSGEIQKVNQETLRTNNKLDALAREGKLPILLPWEFGGINGTTGEDYAPDNYRMRTVGYYTTTRDKIYYSVPDGFRLIAYQYAYDSETDVYTFVKTQGYVTGNGAFSVTVGDYYRFILRGVTDFTFSGDEYEALTLYHDCTVFVKPDDVHEIMDTWEQHPVPAYWADTLAAKESEIKALVVEATKADQDVAMFFTVADPHYPANTGVSTALMGHLAKTCGISLTVCLGDLITDSINSHEEGLERIQAGMAELGSMSDRMIMTQGNHDNNAGITDGNGQILAERIIYDKEWILHTSAKLLSLNKLVFDEHRKAFYYDDDLQKIRFISIDAFEGKTYTIDGGVVKSYDLGRPSERQIAWIQNAALQNVPDGYAVVSFSHLALFAPYVSNGQEFMNLNHGQIGNADKLRAVFNEYTAGGGVYIGHFAGHLHHDFVTAQYGIVCVQSLNDGTHWREASYFGEGFEFVGDAPAKTAGTTTECAFDVVVINKTTRHVDLIRVGAGNNRGFDY